MSTIKTSVVLGWLDSVDNQPRYILLSREAQKQYFDKPFDLEMENNQI